LGTILIGAANYTPGGAGAGPVLAISDLDLADTSGPYRIFLATHPGGSTLTKQQIETGSGQAVEALSFADDDGVVTGRR